MKVLLDTYTFLWWITDNSNLSENSRNIIKNPENVIFFSAASAWEISIKAGLGRLDLKESPDKLIPDELSKNTFSILPIKLRHALKVYSLPNFHKDPFDRLLIAQSIIEEMPILSKDDKIKEYSIKIIW